MPKRTVHPMAQKILKTDAYLTDLLCKLCDKFSSVRSLRTHYKVLEVSGNGIVWLGGWLAIIWILWNPRLFEMQVNFYVGLIVDIIAIAILKSVVRRRRPPGNKPDAMVTIGPDQYSFPSGHVSRVVFIAFFFYYLYPIGFLFYPPLLAWTVSVSLSRILLRRHYILDVIAGVLLGIIECYIIAFMWLGHDTAKWIVTWLSDEKIEGGEYHV
ncbi:polyisoprenoid diphosphate/phosphate phosphohydrolase PLPP6 [Lycorma delicatula]|uniref:polyisoprenoid diphosphate/phosphate phosphohydrolase PLPP6 n=1 Tax=Lycorma delicatula TaxID=130591 RepID=UPI003F517FB6